MTKLVGIVETENPEDMGTTVFTLCDSTGNHIRCRSGAGCKSTKPKKGDKVIIIGDTIRDLITGGESFEFFYTLLDVVPSVSAEAAG
jgi:hypothetical protein